MKVGMVNYDKVWQKHQKLKRRLHALKKWTSFNLTFVLILILIPLLVLTAWALRENNLGMLERRDQVLWSDEFGTSDELEQSVRELQSYVAGHMNTYIGPTGLSLQHSYDRAVARAVQEAAQAQEFQISDTQYAQYHAACQGQLSVGQWAYTNCIAEKIGYQGQNLSLEGPELPPAELYYVNFVAPRWSPDWAGWLILIDLILVIVISIRLLFWLLVQAILWWRRPNLLKKWLKHLTRSKNLL